MKNISKIKNNVEISSIGYQELADEERICITYLVSHFKSSDLSDYDKARLLLVKLLAFDICFAD